MLCNNSSLTAKNNKTNMKNDVSDDHDDHHHEGVMSIEFHSEILESSHNLVYLSLVTAFLMFLVISI